MKITVECYAGYKRDERPVRFRMGLEEYVVEAVLDQWYAPDGESFKVRASGGRIYTLRRREQEWMLEPCEARKERETS